MNVEQQILDLAMRLKEKHLVASMEDALERARLIIQSAPLQGMTTEEASTSLSEISDSALQKDTSDNTKKDLEKIKQDLAELEQDLEES